MDEIIIKSIIDESKNIFEKTNKTELGWIIGGQILFGLGSLVGIKLITSLLNPDDYGTLTLVVTFSTLFLQIVYKPIQQSATRFISSAKEESKLDEFLHATKKLFFQATLIVSGISLLIILLFFVTQNQNISKILIITAIFTIFSAYKSTIDSLLNTLFLRKLSVVFQTSEIWFRYILASLLLLLITRNVFYVLLGYSISVMVTYLIETIKFNKIVSGYRKEGQNSTITDWRKLLINYGLPFSLWGIFSWFEFAAPRWILQLYSSTYEVGLFAASFQLGFYPIALISGVILQYATPIAFTEAGFGMDKVRLEKAYYIIKIIAFVASLITLIAFIFSLEFANTIVYYLLGSSFSEASKYFPYFILSSGLFMIGQVFELFFQTANKTRELLYIKILTSLLLLATSFLFTYKFGLAGLVYSLLSTYFFYALITYLKSRTLFK